MRTARQRRRSISFGKRQPITRATSCFAPLSSRTLWHFGFRFLRQTEPSASVKVIFCVLLLFDYPFLNFYLLCWSIVDVTVDSCNNGAPSVSSSNFEVINSRLEQRTAIVRWSLQRPSECRPIGSSSSRGYEIYLLDMKGNTLYVYYCCHSFSTFKSAAIFIKRATKRVDSGNTTSVTFENLVRQEAYKFVILPNQNKFDSSLNDYLPLPINSSLQHHVFLPTSFNSELYFAAT